MQHNSYAAKGTIKLSNGKYNTNRRGDWPMEAGHNRQSGGAASMPPGIGHAARFACRCGVAAKQSPAVAPDQEIVTALSRLAMTCWPGWDAVPAAEEIG
jgi:hypothetical protein